MEKALPRLEGVLTTLKYEVLYCQYVDEAIMSLRTEEEKREKYLSGENKSWGT